MPVKVEITPPPPSQSKQLGFPKTLLYNGSKFEGSQKSKGNSYAVEVVLQVNFPILHFLVIFLFVQINVLLDTTQLELNKMIKMNVTFVHVLLSMLSINQ